MATASARAHGGGGHHQQPPPQPHGLRYEPLRRMQGLDLKAALRASSPRAPTVATAALLVPQSRSVPRCWAPRGSRWLSGCLDQ